MWATWTELVNALLAMERAVMAERKLAVMGTWSICPYSIECPLSRPE